MKRTLNISIEKPCTENYASFNKTKVGGFCKSCAKEVIDFTNKTDTEISTYFKNRKGNTCGYFYANQLKTYPVTRNKNELQAYSTFGAFSFSFISLFNFNATFAQKNKPDIVMTVPSKNLNIKQVAKNPIIKGIVYSNKGNVPLPGVSIVLKNNILGTNTDFDGNFELANIKENDILSFYYLGYRTQEVIIKKNQTFLKVILEEDSTTLDKVIVMGAVDTCKTYKTKRSVWQRIKSIF